MIERMAGDYDRVSRMLSEASDLVYRMIDCKKPIVSAINGVAVGAGLGGRAAGRYLGLCRRCPPRRRTCPARGRRR